MQNDKELNNLIRVVLESVGNFYKDGQGAFPPVAMLYLAKEGMTKMEYIEPEPGVFDGPEKIRFALTIKDAIANFQAQGFEVRYYMMVVETWFVTVPRGEKLPEGIQSPSASPQREDGLAIFAETEEEAFQLLFTVTRHPHIKIAQIETLPQGESQFINILCKKKATPNERMGQA